MSQLNRDVQKQEVALTVDKEIVKRAKDVHISFSASDKTTLNDSWMDDYLNNSVNKRTKTDSPDIIIVNNRDIENASKKKDLALTLMNVEEAEIIEQNNDLAKLTVKLNDYEWTREKIINILFQRLAHVKIFIQNEAGEKLEVSKYYLQVLKNATRIPVYRPSPEFIIYLSDLGPQIIRQLLTFEEETRRFILVESVSRLDTFAIVCKTTK